jgi:hypothetical protein
MNRFPSWRVVIVLSGVIGAQSFGLLFQDPLSANDEESKAVQEDNALAKQRLALMQKRMAAARVNSAEDGFPEKFSEKPIFRYTDPARNYVAAAVWKLGETGRPRAIITTELHRQYFGKPRIVYEYLSLTDKKFFVSEGDFGWMPEGTTLQFKPVPDAPVPDETPSRRLRQMRAIINRFAGSEVVAKERCELRLLPQPIDRYSPSTADRADGAIFIAAFGTNPEALLFIESDGKAWTYAVGRLSGAQAISLTIDGTTAWEGPPVHYNLNSSYTASNAAADIPGLNADGSAVKGE